MELNGHYSQISTAEFILSQLNPAHTLTPEAFRIDYYSIPASIIHVASSGPVSELHYFISQIATFFTRALSRDGKHRVVHRYSSLP